MSEIKTWWQQHWRINTILLVLAALSIIFVAHDQFLYRQLIGKVVSTKMVKRQKEVDQFHNVDYQMKQNMILKVMNGRYRGRLVHVSNTYSQSGGMDQHYHRGQQAFLTQLSTSHGTLTANVSGLKRDTTVVFLLWVVVLLLIGTLGKMGGLTLASVAMNILLFIVAISIDVKTQAAYLLFIFIVLAMLMALSTLIFVFGFSKQTFATFISTIIGVSLSVLVLIVVQRITQNRGIYYESMEYVTENYKWLYLAQVIIGCLGAVMDECSDIMATMFEIRRLEPHASRSQLFRAGEDVGKQVMGPLTNVLLMIFLFSTLTNSVLLLRNGNTWGYTFSMCMGLGVAQSLVSGIGIVMTVPTVSGLLALFLTKER